MRLRRCAGVLEQDLDDEVLLLQDGSANALHLNAVATRFWRALVPEADLDDVTSRIAEHYGIEPAVVRADLQPVLAELLAQGVVERAP